MKNSFSIVLTFLLAFVFANCSNSEVKESIIANDVNEFKTVIEEGICKISVPEYFIEMNDINPDAIIQYGFIEDETINNIGNEDEIYVIVLADYKNELREVFGDSVAYQIDKFYYKCIENLSFVLDDFKVLKPVPEIEEKGNLLFIKNEFEGLMGEYPIYYQFAVYQTEIGYYQILTWCMNDYKEKHQYEMIRMINSFEEL